MKIFTLFHTDLVKSLSRYRYQIVAIIVILVGYFPVTFQLLSLKNDILQLDLPVKYFISKEIHRGEFPIWMYSWGLGFPLGNFFTWSIYNPITLLFATIFEYNLSTLHLEFLFYILLGAAGAWKLSRGVLFISQFASLIVSVSYALSGITMSCSQFMAYIASIGVLPWVYYFFLRLLKQPTIYNSLSLSFCYFLLISWSYPAAAIICFYSLVGILAVCFFYFKNIQVNLKSIKFLAFSGLLTLILALPLIYQTIYTLPLFSRSEQLTGNVNDFGYLKASSLLSFFSPLIHSNKNFTDTTFLFQNVHIGTLGFGVLISGILNLSSLGRFRKISLFILLAALIALVLSGGERLILKSLLDNILPGFKWFRFPSFFRLFFLLPVVLLIGIFFDTIWMNGLLQSRLRVVCLLVLFISSLVSGYNLFTSFGNYSIDNVYEKSTVGAILISITLLWSVVLFTYSLFNKSAFSNLPKLIIVDLVVIAITSLPIYVVGSYSLEEINEIILSEQSVDNKSINIDNTQGIFTDKRGNAFNGLNVYANTISAANQYIGPLYLQSFERFSDSVEVWKLPNSIIFTDGSSVIKMLNNRFENHTFSGIVSVQGTTKVNLYQLWHPFWKAEIDNKSANVFASEKGFACIIVPPGEHRVSFVFKDRLLSIFTWVFFIGITFLSFSIISIGISGKNV